MRSGGRAGGWAVLLGGMVLWVVAWADAPRLGGVPADVPRAGGSRADAPGVGTPVRGGVTYREAHLAMEMIADTEFMVSLEVVEINPILDEHNRTALLGVELVLSGLGQKIL